MLIRMALIALFVLAPLSAGAQTLEERVAALEARLAALAVDPASVWAPYKFPPDGSPGPFPPSDSGHVLSKPLIIEDPNIHPNARRILSHRLEHDWRMGPSSQGWPYIGGNPKAWFRGGLMVTANGDSPELALMYVDVNEQTGVVAARPPNGSLVGRIYEMVIYGHKATMTARSNDILFRMNGGMEFRSSDNSDTVTPMTALQIVRPRNLHSQSTGLLLGHDDVGVRPILKGRVSDLLPTDYVLFIRP